MFIMFRLLTHNQQDARL